jgi:hypothetical protein
MEARMSLFDEMADNYFFTTEDGTEVLRFNRKSYVLPNPEIKREAHAAIKRYWMLYVGAFLAYIASVIPTAGNRSLDRILPIRASDAILFLFMLWLAFSIFWWRSITRRYTQGLAVSELAFPATACRRSYRFIVKISLILLGLLVIEIIALGLIIIVQVYLRH